MRVGARIPGALRRFPWQLIPHASYDADPEHPLGLSVESTALSLPEALRAPEGTVVYVQADLVRVSHQAPMLCPQEARAGSAFLPCPEGSPRVYDLDGTGRSNGYRTLHRFPGPLYARRFRDGFVQVVYSLGGASGILTETKP